LDNSDAESDRSSSPTTPLPKVHPGTHWPLDCTLEVYLTSNMKNILHILLWLLLDNKEMLPFRVYDIILCFTYMYIVLEVSYHSGIEKMCKNLWDIQMYLLLY